MMKGNNIKKAFTGIIFLLFIVTLFSPMTIGNKNSEQFFLNIKNIKNTLEDLAFICRDSCGYSSYEYYKEKLLEKDTYDFDIIENEHHIVNTGRYYKISLNDPIEWFLISGGLMNSSWPMKSHDTHHTGLSPYSTEDVDGLEKWRFYSEHWIDDSAVIDSDGVIYFGSLGLEFYAVYPNGTEKWNLYIGDWTSCTPAIGEDGTIYFGSWDDYFYAVNPDGSEKWRFLTRANIESSPVIADDGTVYFGTMWTGGNGGKIFALNPDGTEKWHYDTGFFVESDPVIGDDGTIYIGSGDTYFYAMNPNGTLKWRFKTGDEIHGHPSIADDGTIYISSFDDYLYAINPDGTEKWKSDVDYGLSNGVAIGNIGTIYVGRLKMHALDADDGSVIWSTELGNEYWIGESSPCISADGTIYVGAKNGIPTSYGGGILAFNPDGTIKWHKEISFADHVESSPCIGPDGTVYIGSAYHQGFLHAFGPVESNSPPNTPSIDGPTTIEVGKSKWYTIKAVDPDNNPVTFYLDWDDGNEYWYREWASGAPTYAEHAWSEQGNYTVRVKVKDTLGEESDWGYLEVKVPVNQQLQTHNTWFLQFLQNHPKIFPRLQNILNLN